jgi:hypothetical protein
MMFVKYKDHEFQRDDGSKTKDWIGTPSALLGELNSVADSEALNIDTSDRYWPKAAYVLTMRLKEIEPTLKEKGLEIEYLINQGEREGQGY